MIAAARRRIGTVFAKLAKRLARWSRGASTGPPTAALERAHPALLRGGAPAARRGAPRVAAWAGPRLRPLAALLFRGARAAASAGCGGSARRAARGGDRGPARSLTPRRAIGAVIVAAGACLVVSQFVDYRGGRDRPARLRRPAAASPQPPTVDVETAGDAHAYLLVPVGAARRRASALLAAAPRAPRGSGSRSSSPSGLLASP